jgi:hypothetical protein
VWKEKSKLRASGALVKRRKVEQSTKKMSDETIILSTDDGIRTRDNTHYEHMNITALDSDGLMELYKEFNRGRKPCDIIADHGFHPEVVEKEYNRFLQLNERDPDSLQKAYIPSIIKYPLEPEEADALFSKYKTKGYLNNDEFLKLLKFKSDYDEYHGIHRFAYNEIVSPYGYTAIRCKNCCRPMPDVIVNINTNIGKEVLESYKTLCYPCYLKVEDDDMGR